MTPSSPGSFTPKVLDPRTPLPPSPAPGPPACAPHAGPLGDHAASSHLADLPFPVPFLPQALAAGGSFRAGLQRLLPDLTCLHDAVLNASSLVCPYRLATRTILLRSLLIYWASCTAQSAGRAADPGRALRRLDKTIANLREADAAKVHSDPQRYRRAPQPAVAAAAADLPPSSPSSRSDHTSDDEPPPATPAPPPIPRGGVQPQRGEPPHLAAPKKCSPGAPPRIPTLGGSPPISSPSPCAAGRGSQPGCC